jgi:hypothetical protein
VVTVKMDLMVLKVRGQLVRQVLTDHGLVIQIT